MTAPLTADRIPDALHMMERFYAEIGLEFVSARARHALEGLAQFGGWWFLESEGVAIGYFVLTIGYSLEFGGRYALLDEFFVEPAWRGKGIGTAALDRILEEAAAMGVAAVHLEADRHDGRVQAFYQRAGFAPRGREMMTRWV
jgi:GNAT superfamily N-acetyltransferase